MSEFDVIVIGGGPGGYSAAIRAAQAGFETACIERESVGGVCLNWGCIPSKALISVAQRRQWALSGAELGVEVDAVRVNMERAQGHIGEVVGHHVRSVGSLLKTNGARLIHGSAKLTSNRTVEVSHADGSSSTLVARRGIVIATGADLRGVPGFTPDGSRVLTAKDAVFLDHVPKHLIVLGGGVIGLELGSAFHALGSKLTVVELGGALLPGIDADLVAVVRRRLERSGAEFLLNTAARSARSTESGLVLQLTGGSSNDTPRELQGSCVLVAAGFVPRTDSLGLAAAGVQLDERGHILTRENCETTSAGIYAIGDIAGPPYLAHKAFAEAQVVADALQGRGVKRDWQALPSAIFTNPEIATVGLSEAAATSAGREIRVGRFPFAASGRAMARGETDGFVKLLAEDGRIVGAGIVGPEASELIAELTLAIEVGATLEDLSLTIHTHPTLTEAIHDAAEHALGSAVHIVNRRAAKPRLAFGATPG